MVSSVFERQRLSCAAVGSAACVFFMATILAGCGGGGDNPAPSPTPPSKKPQLPDVMIAGYTSGASVENITKAVKKGVNVIFWSFMELDGDSLKGGVSSKAVGPAYDALVQINRQDVLHFVSFGGWDEPHKLAGTCGAKNCSGDAYAKAFRAWNDEMKSNISGFLGFAGIDWDLEGMDNVTSQSNHFTLETLEIMLSMSKALQSDFLISMVPPQSYFNCRDSGFNTNLENSALSTPSFKYAGKNVYAVLYAKCPDCFDVVMVQLYESFSQAGFDLYWQGDTSHIGQPGWPKAATGASGQALMQQVIRNAMQCLASGWTVDFNGFWNVPNQTVVVPPSKIVIGLGNRWANNGGFKVVYFDGTPCGKAWCAGVSYKGVSNMRTRGFMYWDIHDDSANVSLVTDIKLQMTTNPNCLVNSSSAEPAGLIV